MADIADNVMVMYAGRAAEKATKRDTFYQPHHPDNQGLLSRYRDAKRVPERLQPPDELADLFE